MTALAAAPRARRIWCETVPLERLVHPDVTRLLRRYQLTPIVAVRPADLAFLPRLTHALAEAALPVALWPMVADEDGRWASTLNAATFAAFAEATVNAAGAPVTELALDLEPPFAHVRALTGRGGLRGMAALVRDSARTWDEGLRALEALVSGLQARGVAVSAALPPHVLLDGPRRHLAQRALGTPALWLPFSHASVMAYTSMLEGWGRPLVNRQRALSLLGWCARRARRLFGERAGVSLGAVGTGALGDEPVYRHPGELREDVERARAAGCDVLTLFDLGGVLARGRAEAWLEAFAA